MCATQSFFGRADLLSPLVNSDSISVGDLAETDSDGSALRKARNHLKQLVGPREFICKQDASCVIRSSVTRNLRSGAKLTIDVEVIVGIFVPALKRRVGGYRCVGKTDSHVILEKGESSRNIL